MSWQATSWASGLEYEACGPLAFRVLIKLANNADDDGRSAYRSKEKLASELGVSQRSIQRAIRELEHARLLIRGDQRLLQHIRADRRPTVYDLNMTPSVLVQQPPLYAETELSTDVHGETTVVADGETTVVVKNHPLNHPVNSSRDNHTADVAPSEFDRCIFGGTHQRVGGECVRCGLDADHYWLRDGTAAEVPA